MAQNVAFSPAKRARKPNFTPAEWTVIFEEAEENIKTVKSKISTTLSNKRESRVWEVITDKVNALGFSKRSVKWRGMTRGGMKPDSPKATTAKIIEIFETDPSFSGISWGVDSAQVSSSSTVDIEVLRLGCKLQPVTSPCELPETCEPSDPCEASQLDCNSSIYSDIIPSLVFQMLAILAPCCP
ncbi:unnamed protein product [Pocillopora meandrina]|uniref:Myb/SANT-like DNA-binding domain-containing protein n=1 Tax=Pocillopora meandrina TaxID=46732 RepID=A0AAU9XFS8_9CNID|nr:unnamed protein product [Pocillopora meandrina]